MSFDALSFCRDSGIKYWTEGENVTPGWVNIKCPLCTDKSNHGGFNPTKGYFSCWKCGGHGLSYVIGRLLRIDRTAAEKVISQYEGSGLLRPKIQHKHNPIETLTMIGEPLQTVHKRYLKRRGFDPDLLERKYSLTGTGIVGDWKYRIMIPILHQGQLVSYQGRDVTDAQKLRYKTLSPDKSLVNPKHILYNLDNCRGNTIVVVEGAFDVFRMGDGFAATLGTSMTEAQIKILSRYRRVVFLFDPEPEAQGRARKAANKLSAMGVETELVDLEMEEDPGELSPKQVRMIRRELEV